MATMGYGFACDFGGSPSIKFCCFLVSTLPTLLQLNVYKELGWHDLVLYTAIICLFFVGF